MTRLRSALACAVVLTLAGGARAGAQPAPAAELRLTALDTSALPTVTAALTVPPALAGADLPPGAFAVTENGRPVTPVVTRLPAEDIEVVLVVDTSGSMAGGPMESARAAVATFLGTIPASTKVGVVGFGPAPVLAAPLSADRAAVSAAVRGLKPAGETALYDALDLAVRQFSPGGTTRRSVVLLSDGGDTASTATLEATSAALAASGVHLDVAQLLSADSNGAALARLAVAGRGRVAPAADPAALAGIYDDIARSLANQYLVSFRSTGGGRMELGFSLAWQGVTATARSVVQLPGAVSGPRPGTAARPSPGPAPHAPGVLATGWGLGAGAGACFVAMVLVAAAFVTPQRRRDRLARLGQVGLTSSPSTAVAGLAERAAQAADQALARRGRRGSLNAALERAGIALRPGEFVVLAATAGVGALLVGLLLSGLFLGVLLAAAVGIGSGLVLTFSADRRRARFADQLDDTLQMLAGSLRAGYGLLQAFDAVAREAESPTREEFRRLVVETRLGRGVSESLHVMAERVASEDYEWVVQAIDIHREVGGDLAEVLDTVAGTIRERNQLRRQVKALSAEGRLSAYVLLALPFLLALFMRFSNPSYLGELGHGFGLVLSGAAVALMVAGALWLKKICRLVF